MLSLRLAPLLMGNHVGTHGREGFVWSRILSPPVGENSYLLPREDELHDCQVPSTAEF